MKIPRLLCATLGFALLANAYPGGAHAQLVEDGLYAGGAFNLALENFSDTGPFDFDDAPGVDVRLGSRIGPLFAIELQYEWTGVFEAEDQGREIDVEQHVVTANGKLFPFAGRLEPYLMAGVGYSRAELEGGGTLRGSDDLNGLVVRVGTGFQLGLLEALSLSVEGGFVLPTGDVNDLSYFTLSGGLNVHFRGL